MRNTSPWTVTIACATRVVVAQPSVFRSIISRFDSQSARSLVAAGGVRAAATSASRSGGRFTSSTAPTSCASVCATEVSRSTRACSLSSQSRRAVGLARHALSSRGGGGGKTFGSGGGTTKWSGLRVMDACCSASRHARFRPVFHAWVRMSYTASHSAGSTGWCAARRSSTRSNWSNPACDRWSWSRRRVMLSPRVAAFSMTRSAATVIPVPSAAWRIGSRLV